MEDQTAISARARASEIGLKPESIDGFSGMDRETLIVQAALWREQAMAHQNRALDVEVRSAEVIDALFDLCRMNQIAITDELYERACSINDRWTPAKS